MDKLTKPISQHLNGSDNHLGWLLAKARQLQELEQVFKGLVDGDLALHCRVANLQDQQLIIEADSAVWATRLRYLFPSLLTALKSLPGLEELQGLKSYVRSRS